MAVRWTVDNMALFVSFLSLQGFHADPAQSKSLSSQDSGKDEFLTPQHKFHGLNSKRVFQRHRDITDEDMRALVDISKNDDVTYRYSDYYDTIDIDPSYYDILDYVYVDLDNSTDGAVTESSRIVHEKHIVDSSQHTSTSSSIGMSSPNDNENSTYPDCDPKTHFGCKIAKFERCNSKTSTCQCLNGYVDKLDQFGRSSCLAADFFRGHLKTSFTGGNGLNISSQAIQHIESNLTAYLELLLAKQGGIPELLAVKVQVPTLLPLSKLGFVALTFDVALTRSSTDLDHRHAVRDIWHKDLGAKSEGLPNALNDLLQSIGWNNSLSSSVSSTGDVKDLFSPLVETNPCHHTDHNYCGPSSTCRVQDGASTCTCETGYQDVSPDVIQAPGETCVEDCRCENGGLCVEDPTADTMQCSCLNWYFGSNCQINGKELLVICCCSLGSLLVMAAVFWCCYYCCIKHKLRDTKTNLFSFTPNTNFLKLPRVWMDSRYENDISPRSIRRMSFASECNPYLDAYILEDLPPSAIQSQRRGDLYGQHYQSGNQGVATVSSHSFFCPY